LAVSPVPTFSFLFKILTLQTSLGIYFLNHNHIFQFFEPKVFNLILGLPLGLRNLVTIETCHLKHQLSPAKKHFPCIGWIFISNSCYFKKEISFWC
jgi:hypothetical protein